MMLGMTLAAGWSATAEARSRPIYPWCAHISGADWVTDCSFRNFEQCRATVSGIGGFCSPNAAYAAAVDEPSERRLRRR
jgi:hypothetical protein